MKAHHGARWRRHVAQARRRADRNAEQMQRLYDTRAELQRVCVRVGVGYNDVDVVTHPATAPLYRRAARLEAAWERTALLAGDDAARFTFRSKGAGVLYLATDLARPALGWHAYGRVRYVSRQRYAQLDTSALVTIRLVTEPNRLHTDYVGFAPEDRGYFLSPPTRRHRSLDRWRAANARPVQAARWMPAQARVPDRAWLRRVARMGARRYEAWRAAGAPYASRVLANVARRA